MEEDIPENVIEAVKEKIKKEYEEGYRKGLDFAKELSIGTMEKIINCDSYDDARHILYDWNEYEAPSDSHLKGLCKAIEDVYEKATKG